MQLYKSIIPALAILLIFSCADLEELNPVNEIPTQQAIVDKVSAAAAINGIYDACQNDALVSDGWLFMAQLFSDEADATGTFPNHFELDNINVYPSNFSFGTTWAQLYKVINNANNVIELVPKIEDPALSEEEKADFVARAKFLRAQAYLQLVVFWKEVPLILSPTSEPDASLFVPKNTGAEVYTQIIADLNEAEKNLLAGTGPNFASKLAARAFLARVFLYQGKWMEAKAKALDVLGAGFDLATIPYLEDRIYSLGFTSTDGNYLNFYYGPADFGGRYSLGPSLQLIAAFEPGDLRFSKSIDTSSASVPFCVKYPSFSAGISGTATDPLFFIRHAEMVLIVAEAAAETGDFDTANLYFKQVRQRAGLPPVTLDAGNFVDRILHERFVEFAFEGPFRLIDLRRKGKAIEVLGPFGYDPCDDVFPIPQTEIDRNPKLVQNKCCNC